RGGPQQLPRRRPVPRHPGIYYRPRRDGKVAPPYEIRFLDSAGKHRWEVVHANLEVAEARRAELRLRRRRGERIEPSRQTFEQYRCLLELLLTSGLRIGEALGLTVADLDGEQSLIRVEYQLGRDGARTPLKTEESRRVLDLPPELMRRLVALVNERGARFNRQ